MRPDAYHGAAPLRHLPYQAGPRPGSTRCPHRWVQGLLDRLKQVKQDSTCSSAGRASHAGCGGPTRGWHALRGRYNMYGAVSARAAQEMAKPKARLA